MIRRPSPRWSRWRARPCRRTPPAPDPGPVLSGVLRSRRSERVVELRELHGAPGRRRQGLFLIEGPGGVFEAIASGRAIEIFATADAPEQVLRAAERAGIDVTEMSAAVADALAETETPQGVLALCRMPSAGAVPRHGCRLAVILASVADPGNAGTIIRTADAMGAGAVLLAGASVDPYNGKCVRASAGSILRVPVAAGIEVAEAVHRAQEAGMRVRAAVARGGASLEQLDLAAPTAWLLGSEAHGLAPQEAALADELVTIAMPGGAESLNVAAAAAILLHASAAGSRA